MKYPTEIYSFKVNTDNTFNYFNDLYINGKENDKKNSKIINVYSLLGSNCATIVADGLRENGIFVPRNVNTPIGFLFWQRAVSVPPINIHIWGF